MGNMSEQNIRFNQRGEINGLAIILIVVIFLLVGVSGFAVWAVIQKDNAESNLSDKVQAAVDAGKKDQIAADNKDYAEREKQPYRQFVGPDDLGAVQFSYPKTWSAYVDKSGSSGIYEAYFYPIVVPPISSKTPNALRLSVTPRSYDEVVKSYEGKVKSGDLRSSPVTVQGFNGLKLEGNFTKETPNAVLIIFKIRDKTMLISSESPQYFSDFNNVVLTSLRFNP